MDTSWVGRQLRAERAVAGMTRTALAAKAGLSVLTISRIEMGQRAGRVDHLLALCEALDVPMDVFFARANERQTATQS